MGKPLALMQEPCTECPYRRTTPAGIWDASEYEKLRGFVATGSETPALGVFLCHYTPDLEEETVCRGWLTVEQDSIAVRLALCEGLLTGEQVYAKVRAPLYETGEEATRAGLAGLDEPSPQARTAIRRLVRTRRKRRG